MHHVCVLGLIYFYFFVRVKLFIISYYKLELGWIFYAKFNLDLSYVFDHIDNDKLHIFHNTLHFNTNTVLLVTKKVFGD